MGSRISGRTTFGGLASGLDTNALLEGLLAIERQPLQRIQARRGEVDAQRSLVRQLNTKLLALRDAARGLDNRNTRGSDESTNEEFVKYQTSSTNEDVVQISADKSAAAGDIQVRVDQLARGSRRFSTAFTVDANADEDADDALALQSGQSIRITLPNGQPLASPVVEATDFTITAGASGMSLAKLREEINSATGNDGKVQANILQASEGVYRLVLTSTETGTQNELQITGDLAMEVANPDGSDNAQNAQVTIFGQTVERQSNKITDVLAGITLDLKRVAERDDNDQPITETLSISVDTEAIATSIESFVGAYNDVIDFLDNQSKYNETTKTAGPLSGDSILRDIQRRLRDVVSEAYRFDENLNNRYALGVDANGAPLPGGSISGVGIELVGDGRLRLDREVLADVLAQDPLAVREFMSGRGIDESGAPLNQAAIDAAIAWNAKPSVLADPDLKKEVPKPDYWQDGFFTNLGAQLEEIVRSGDGLMAERDKLFATRLKTFDASIDSFNMRLARREEMLVQRFTVLERVISGLQNQQGFLSGLR